MLLCSSTDWKWRILHQSSPFVLIHYWFRPTVFILNSTTDEHSCSCQAQYWKPAVRLFIPLCWLWCAWHLIFCLDLVHNTTLAGQQHCVILSFYSCDLGVSLQSCVVCPTWSFLSHCLCCYPHSQQKTSCGFRSFALIVDIWGGWMWVNSHWPDQPHSLQWELLSPSTENSPPIEVLD